MSSAVNLCDTQRTSKLNINSQKINVNDIVLVHDKMSYLENCHGNRCIT